VPGGFLRRRPLETKPKVQFRQAALKICEPQFTQETEQALDIDGCGRQFLLVSGTTYQLQDFRVCRQSLTNADFWSAGSVETSVSCARSRMSTGHSLKYG
jgi:hypothetical protein